MPFFANDLADRLLIHRKAAVAARPAVFALPLRDALPISRDRIAAHIRRGRVARAAVSNAQILAVEVREADGVPLGTYVRRAPVVVGVDANGVADGLLVRREAVVGERDVGAGRQACAVTGD